MIRAQMPPAQLTTCGTCGAEVAWATTDNAKKMLVEVSPDPTGNLVLSLTGAGLVHARVVAAKLAFGRADLHLSHFARCKQASSWRRR